MKYKVLDPKGITFRGDRVETGKTFGVTATGADVRALLHFKQIEPSEEKESDEEETPSGPEVSEAARKLAEEKGIDLSTITGTGANGSIIKPDVEAAIAAAK